MFAPTRQKKYKILLFFLGAVLLLFAEAALAKKSGNKAGRSRSSPKTQKVAKASGGSKNRASSHGRARSKVVQSPTPAISETKLDALQRPSLSGRSKPVRQQNTPDLSPRTVKADIGLSAPLQPSAGPKIPKPVNSTSSRKPVKPNLKTTAKGPAKTSNWKRLVARTTEATGRAKTSLKQVKQKLLNKLGKGANSDKTARIATPISKAESPVTTVAKVTRDRSPTASTGKVVRTDKRKALDQSITVLKAPKKSVQTKQSGKRTRLKTVDKIRTTSRTKQAALQGRETLEKTGPVSRKRDNAVNRQKTVSRSKEPVKTDRELRSGRRRRNQRKGSAKYEDRSRLVKRIHRHEHVYRDRRGRISHRIVWPRYFFPVYYSWGPFWTFRYVYPYYHRRYVFVSLGGYWPTHYRYVRYYWYGWHPYEWYGYYPLAYEVAGDTYNYYTYNYNYADSLSASGSYQPTDTVGTVDHTTFADVRERLAQQTAAEPDVQTQADSYFEEAVKAFEEGDYAAAAEKFAEAMALAPEDMVLPFAYTQAFFANGQYTEAAWALRSALQNVPAEAEGVFYPRGLYTEEDLLFEQIDLLSEVAELYSSDADIQLLLGYQLLGIGEIDEALEPLQKASLDLNNKDAAEILLDLLERIRTEDAENTEQ
jgi:tetratricopeptide (TPR) repeat protein